jgi:hypothetical protein
MLRRELVGSVLAVISLGWLGNGEDGRATADDTRDGDERSTDSDRDTVRIDVVIDDK